MAESTRAAEAIRKNFGVSAEKAFDLIAAGAQNGLDFSGELIDTINEYSVQFSKLGLSADDMFQILQSGADGTAWNLDKVGDAVKEFSIRAIDGSDTTISAFQALGYNADEMMATFAAGGEGANQAFFEVLDQLLSMDDQVQRDAVGVKLFGTMWEDLGAGALQAMADASSAAYSTGEALDQINQTQYNDLDSALEGVRRHLEVAMLPAADAVYQSLMEHMPEVTGALDEMSPVIQEIAGDFGDMAVGAFTEALPQLAAGLRDFADWAGQAYTAAQPFLAFLWKHKGTVAAFAVALRMVGPAVNTISKGMEAFGKAKTFFALLQASGKLGQFVTILKAAGTALAGPLGIILAIGTALVLLYKNWSQVDALVQSFIAMVGGALPGGGGFPPGLLAVHPGRRRQRPGHHPEPFGFRGQRLCRQLVRRLAECGQYLRQHLRDAGQYCQGPYQRGHRYHQQCHRGDQRPGRGYPRLGAGGGRQTAGILDPHHPPAGDGRHRHPAHPGPDRRGRGAGSGDAPVQAGPTAGPVAETRPQRPGRRCRRRQHHLCPRCSTSTAAPPPGRRPRRPAASALPSSSGCTNR